MKFRIEHTFEGPPEKVWELIWDREFEKELKEALNLEELKIIEELDEGDTILIRRKVTPKISIPAAIKKIAGDKISYIEENRIKKGTFSFTWEIKLNTLQDRVKTGGVFYVEPYGENGAKRVVEGEIKVNIFGLGRSIEKLVVNNLKENFDKATKLMNQKLKEGK